MRQFPIHRQSRRYFLLLEVLIAFTLVIFCAIPLIYPHIELLKSQQKMIGKMQLDHVVNMLYGDVVEQLYMNRIRWTDIENRRFSVDAATIKRLNNNRSLPYQGVYYFTLLNHRPKTFSQLNVYEWQLTFEFSSPQLSDEKIQKKGEKPLQYSYKVVMVRDLRPPGAA